MDDEHVSENHLFISLRHEFDAVRVIDRLISPTKIRTKLDFSIQDTDDENHTAALEIGRAKINYFMREVLRDCVLIGDNNPWAKEAFLHEGSPSTHNPVMLCSEEPSDPLLAELLMCKFKALSGNAFEFHSMEIEASDSDGMAFLFVGMNPGSSLPVAKEWLTDKNHFSRPWWHRDDASVQDIRPQEGEELGDVPQWAYSLGFLADDVADQGLAPSNVVVRGEFRPHVIQGGKTTP